MLVVFEGPDLAGKTTAAKRIAEMFDLRYVKEHVTGSDVFEQSVHHLSLKNAVIDRCYFTETVYSRFDERKGRSLTDEELWSLGLMLAGNGALVVLLCPPDEELIRRHKERGDPDQSIERILAVAAAYRGLANEWWVPRNNVIVGSECDLRNDLDFAKASSAIQALARSILSITKDGWGTPLRESVLLVGDRRNVGKDARPYHRPFLTRRRECCGGYLFEMLKRAGLGPGSVYLMNAYDPDGTPRDRTIIEIAHFNTVVALGQNASAWCGEKAALRIEHPQFSYRFWHDFAQEFGAELGEDLRRLRSRASQNKC